MAVEKITAETPSSKELSVHRENVLSVQQFAHAFTIKTQEDVAKGEQLLRDIKTVETAQTQRKEEMTRPMMKALSSVRDLFRPFETGLAEAKKTIKEKMLAYQIEAEEKARVEQERIEKRVEKGTMKTETAVAKIENISKSRVKTNVRTLVKVRIVDETAIPREWCAPDMGKITEAVLRLGVIIPGVERYEEKTIVTR